MIVNASGCEWTKLPLVPVIVMVVTSGSVPASTLTVAMDVAVLPPGSVTVGGEKVTWTPVGRELAVSATAELNDPIEPIVTVSVAEAPAPTLRVGEVSDNEKSALEVTLSVKDVV